MKYLLAFLLFLSATPVFAAENVYFDLYWDSFNGYVQCSSESIDCGTFLTDYPTASQFIVSGGSNDGIVYTVDYATTTFFGGNRLYLFSLPIEGNDYGINVTLSTYTPVVDDPIFDFFGDSTPIEAVLDPVTDGVQTTGGNVWPLFTIAGVPITFMIGRRLLPLILFKR